MCIGSALNVWCGSAKRLTTIRFCSRQTCFIVLWLVCHPGLLWEEKQNVNLINKENNLKRHKLSAHCLHMLSLTHGSIIALGILYMLAWILLHVKEVSWRETFGLLQLLKSFSGAMWDELDCWGKAGGIFLPWSSIKLFKPSFGRFHLPPHWSGKLCTHH